MKEKPKFASVSPRPTDPSADAPLPRLASGNRYGKQLRDSDPTVAAHIARVIFANAFDYEAAVAELAPKEWNGEEIASEGARLKRSPYVARELQKLYEKFGLDDKSFSLFKRVIWQRFLEGRERAERIASAKILAAGFGIAEKASDKDKPTELRIKGLEAGLQRMGITDERGDIIKVKERTDA